MRYRPFGSTGIQVSEITLGAMTFGEAMPPITKVDDTLADRLVGRALDAGINCFDTANVYADGRSEEMLGRALRAKRDDVLIATKCGFGTGSVNTSGLSYSNVIASAEASLGRLGTDRIDLFQVHRPDRRTPIDETTRALDDLVRRGLVRYVGFCNFEAWRAALAVGHQRHHRLAAFQSAQMYYSMLGRGIEREVVPLAEHLGLAVLPWSPLAGGFLTGKYTGQVDGNGRRATMPFPPVDPVIGNNTIEALGEVARAHDASVVQVSLAWLLAKRFVTSVIVGVSSLEQLDENLGAVDVHLSADELMHLDGITASAVHAPFWWPELFEDPESAEQIGRDAAAP